MKAKKPSRIADAGEERDLFRDLAEHQRKTLFPPGTLEYVEEQARERGLAAELPAESVLTGESAE
jgi:hypothetical protein